MPYYNEQETGGNIAFYDEGVLQGTASEFDVVGAGVSLAVAGGRATVTIPGGASLSEEVPTGTINGVNTTFTATNSPAAVTINGQWLNKENPNAAYTISGAGPYTITLVVPPQDGDIIRSYY